MISLVICSRESIISTLLHDNISRTIGCGYEWVVVDNSGSNLSIYEAYNAGLARSKNEIICFIHDDIIFRSDGWGKYLVELFTCNPQLGLIGVAGSKIKSRSPSPWWGCDKKYHVQNIVQHKDDHSVVKLLTGFNNESLVQVVVIDGVFFALRRDPLIRFNEKFSGFHNYDLNISIEYWLKKYTAFVTREILIEHFSSGSLDESWLKSTAAAHDYYKDILPISVGNETMDHQNDKKNFENFITSCFKEGQIVLGLKYWLKLIALYPFTAHYGLLVKHLLKGLMSK